MPRLSLSRPAGGSSACRDSINGRVAAHMARAHSRARAAFSTSCPKASERASESTCLRIRPSVLLVSLRSFARSFVLQQLVQRARGLRALPLVCVGLAKLVGCTTQAAASASSSKKELAKCESILLVQPADGGYPALTLCARAAGPSRDCRARNHDGAAAAASNNNRPAHLPPPPPQVYLIWRNIGSQQRRQPPTSSRNNSLSWTQA